MVKYIAHELQRHQQKQQELWLLVKGSPGEETVDGGTNGGGGENGGDPGQGFPITGPHRFKLFAKLQMVNHKLA